MRLTTLGLRIVALCYDAVFVAQLGILKAKRHIAWRDGANMDTIDALTRIAQYIGIAPMTLYTAYELDHHFGARIDGWSPMSVTTDEGRVIYALVRALRPQNVLEFGTLSCCSATHILQALCDNREGNLVSIDIAPLEPPGPPQELYHRWHFVQANGITYNFGDYGCDLCFEDTSHTHDSTRKLCRRALDLGAKLVIVHDAANQTSGKEVCRGLGEIFSRYLIVEPGPDSLGLAICKRSDAKPH